MANAKAPESTQLAFLWIGIILAVIAQFYGLYRSVKDRPVGGAFDRLIDKVFKNCEKWKPLSDEARQHVMHEVDSNDAAEAAAEEGKVVPSISIEVEAAAAEGAVEVKEVSQAVEIGAAEASAAVTAVADAAAGAGGDATISSGKGVCVAAAATIADVGVEGGDPRSALREADLQTAFSVHARLDVKRPRRVDRLARPVDLA